MILVDTDILVDLMRGDGGVGQLLKGLASADTLAVSIVTKMELIVGCRNETELVNLADLFARFRVIAIHDATSEQAVALLEEFRLSHGLLIPDALIAATALTLGCGLLTKNTKHFSFVPGLELVERSS